MLQLTYTWGTWSNVLFEYNQPAYIPIVKTRGFPQEFR